MSKTVPLTDSLEFYTRIAGLYDSMAAISPAFPSPELTYTLISPHMDHYAQDVLDVGIGTGLSSVPFLRKGHQITGVDGCNAMLKLCGEKGISKDLFQVDFTQAVLPFLHGEFDAAFCANTLYLMPETAQHRVINELGRVTKPGGLYAFNYEIRRPGDLGVRFNDATTDLKDPHMVSTYALYTEAVRETLAKHQSTVLESDIRIVARKKDVPIVFETVVCRKLG